MRRKRHLYGAAIAAGFNGELSSRLEQVLELGTYRAEVRIGRDVIRAWRRIEIERIDNFRVVEYARRRQHALTVLRRSRAAQSRRALSIAFTVALIDSKNGDSRTIVAIVRDESQRYEERQLRRRLAELEQQATDFLISEGRAVR